MLLIVSSKDLTSIIAMFSIFVNLSVRFIPFLVARSLGEICLVFKLCLVDFPSFFSLSLFSVLFGCFILVLPFLLNSHFIVCLLKLMIWNSFFFVVDHFLAFSPLSFLLFVPCVLPAARLRVSCYGQPAMSKQNLAICISFDVALVWSLFMFILFPCSAIKFSFAWGLLPSPIVVVLVDWGAAGVFPC